MFLTVLLPINLFFFLKENICCSEIKKNFNETCRIIISTQSSSKVKGEKWSQLFFSTLVGFFSFKFIYLFAYLLKFEKKKKSWILEINNLKLNFWITNVILKLHFLPQRPRNEERDAIIQQTRKQVAAGKQPKRNKTEEK